MIVPCNNAILVFEYTNYKGEKDHRRVVVNHMKFGSNEWHTEPQWLMVAADFTKKAIREFAMKDMTNVKEYKPT